MTTDNDRSAFQMWKIVLSITIPLVTALWGAYVSVGLAIDRACQTACSPLTGHVETRLSCWCMDENNTIYPLDEIEAGAECDPDRPDPRLRFCDPNEGINWPDQDETPSERRVRHLREEALLRIRMGLDPEDP